MDERAANRRFPMATRLPIGSASAETQPSSKAGRLRGLLHAPALSFIMEAHNGLSAKIVEEAGFEGIWASGLSMSAALGVRDNNEASWTQVLEMLEFMADATTIPILVDGDTGYGNFNNVRRLVRKLCQRGIAGVCIEDKLFPKTNSFIGENQPLADMDEFCGRIKAGKDSQNDDDFQLVARVEALIAGWGMDEALRRADAYREAGADAVLIHSKKQSADEVTAFCKAWDNRAPVVIVPTMYHRTPTQTFRNAGVSMVIWANHNMRAAVTAMRQVCRTIRDSESLVAVEEEIAPVQEVFELTGQAELAAAEARYLAAGGGQRAILLAASRGEKLGPAHRTTPEMHDRRAWRAAASTPGADAEPERPARRDGGTRLSQGGDRPRRHRGGGQRSLRPDRRGRLPRLRPQPPPRAVPDLLRRHSLPPARARRAARGRGGHRHRRRCA